MGNATINKPLGFLIGHSLNSQILSDLWEEICVKWIGQRDLVRNWQFFFAIHDNLGALEAATKTRQEDLDGRSFVRSLVYCTGFCIRTIPVHARDSREKIHCVVRRIPSSSFSSSSYTFESQLWHFLLAAYSSALCIACSVNLSKRYNKIQQLVLS